MAEKNEKRKEVAPPASKADVIRASKMPEAQKNAYLRDIGEIKDLPVEGKVPFSVYARIRRLDGSLHRAMLAYPKAKGISSATLIEWDSIFKDF